MLTGLSIGLWIGVGRGEEERALSEGDDCKDEIECDEGLVLKEDAMWFVMRPAAKTHPPTACRISESPAKLPMMNTSLATSSDDSDFTRRVRPDIREDDWGSEACPVLVPSTSERRDGER